MPNGEAAAHTSRGANASSREPPPLPTAEEAAEMKRLALERAHAAEQERAHEEASEAYQRQLLGMIAGPEP